MVDKFLKRHSPGNISVRGKLGAGNSEQVVRAVAVLKTKFHQMFMDIIFIVVKMKCFFNYQPKSESRRTRPSLITCTNSDTGKLK